MKRGNRFKPILFNTDMVKAILSGRKTQTRRLDKSIFEGVHHVQKSDDNLYHLLASDNSHLDDVIPRYKKGDILWVRETHCILPVDSDGRFHSGAEIPYYKADGDFRPVSWRGNWTPSIHMKKKYARLFLEVEEVTLERLMNIDEVSAMQEGAVPCIRIKTMAGDIYSLDERYGKFVQGFAKIWNGTLAKSDRDLYNFDTNPWVWVIRFKRVPKPKDFIVS